jgi:hypothetical protein
VESLALSFLFLFASCSRRPARAGRRQWNDRDSDSDCFASFPDGPRLNFRTSMQVGCNHDSRQGMADRQCDVLVRSCCRATGQYISLKHGSRETCDCAGRQAGTVRPVLAYVVTLHAFHENRENRKPKEMLGMRENKKEERNHVPLTQHLQPPNSSPQIQFRQHLSAPHNRSRQ